ncbi:hypothetical protein NP493_43g00024 [Ridgeia piscesae]|uniref:Uncharacterized protein n=1 Tax=Ridgeia piscesae TaxID=27915 RepID=A0AAD9UJK0_RIDPI|nr:hypothetical protein NP493_43g00024 [Ridgeia piscesae]
MTDRGGGYCSSRYRTGREVASDRGVGKHGRNYRCIPFLSCHPGIFILLLVQVPGPGVYHHPLPMDFRRPFSDAHFFDLRSLLLREKLDSLQTEQRAAQAR